jgi:hypothetical protein
MRRTYMTNILAKKITAAVLLIVISHQFKKWVASDK